MGTRIGNSHVQTGSVCGQLQSVLAKLRKDDDTRSAADFVNGKQHSKITSSGAILQGGERGSAAGKSKVGKSPPDAFEPGNAQSNAVRLLDAQPTIVLPG